MSLSKNEQEFSKLHGSRMPQPRPWQPLFHQASTSYVNGYANGNGQELQPSMAGESTLNREAARAKLSNRRRRQRERRAMKSKSKANQDLGQEMECPELGGDHFPNQAANEMGYGQVPGEDQDTPFPADLHMPNESSRDIYYP